VIPATAFWPRPNVESRILRIDFDAAAAGRVADAAVLTSGLSLAFGQRRKQIGSILKRKDAPFPSERLADALGVAGIARTLRAEQVPPPQYLKLANALCRS
jgi:16S rRNA (adenine1518-N6/adenine1519-N6)-dimethyltransferase